MYKTTFNLNKMVKLNNRSDVVVVLMKVTFMVAGSM